MVKRASMEDEFVSLNVLSWYEEEDLSFFSGDVRFQDFFNDQYRRCLLEIVEKSIRRIKNFVKKSGATADSAKFLSKLKQYRQWGKDTTGGIAGEFSDDFYAAAKILEGAVFRSFLNSWYKRLGIDMDAAEEKVRELIKMQGEGWVDNWMHLLPYLHEKYHPSAEEIDWRPTETIPEDFYAL